MARSTREQVLGIVRTSPGFWDFLAFLGEDGGVLDWFRFRAVLLAAPELVRQLCAAVVENGCDGALFGLEPEKDENLAVIREVFGRMD